MQSIFLSSKLLMHRMMYILVTKVHDVISRNIEMTLYCIHFPRTNVFVHINDKHTPSRPLGEVKFVRVELVL